MKRYPLSPDLAGLPVITAEPWLKIGPGQTFPTMEGADFDREGNLLVCHRTRPWSDVVRISPDRQYETIYHHDDAELIGVAVHKDGRIFAADINGGGGRLIELGPDGSCHRELCGKRLKPNDLAFDQEGNLYVSDFRGDRNNPSGGIYRLTQASDYTDMELTAGGLAAPNGVAFSPDFKLLWTGETTRNCVTRIMLDENRNLSGNFLSVLTAYQGTGFEVMDSTKVDTLGNVYQAVMYGGRALVLNNAGIPIANILLSDREEGGCMYTPNLAISPDSADGYILTSGTNGAWIYHFEALAPGAVLYSHM